MGTYKKILVCTATRATGSCCPRQPPAASCCPRRTLLLTCCDRSIRARHTASLPSAADNGATLPRSSCTPRHGSSSGFGATLCRRRYARAARRPRLVSAAGAKHRVSTHARTQARSLVEGLLHPDQDQRLGCGPSGLEEIKQHPWCDFSRLASFSRRTPVAAPPPLRLACCSSTRASHVLDSRLRIVLCRGQK